MPMTVISVKSSKGEYLGNKYDNILLYAMNPESTNPKVLAGCEVEQMKIKNEIFPALLNKALISLGDPERNSVEHIIGLLISPVYDKWGNTVDFTLALPPKQSK